MEYSDQNCYTDGTHTWRVDFHQWNVILSKNGCHGNIFKIKSYVFLLIFYYFCQLCTIYQREGGQQLINSGIGYKLLPVWRNIYDEPLFNTLLWLVLHMYCRIFCLCRGLASQHSWNMMTITHDICLNGTTKSHIDFQFTYYHSSIWLQVFIWISATELVAMVTKNTETGAHGYSLSTGGHVGDLC